MYDRPNFSAGNVASSLAGSTQPPRNRGLSFAREVLTDQIQKVDLINDNLRQAIIQIHGNFPPSPSALAPAKEAAPNPESIEELIQALNVRLLHTQELSTIINVGH